MSALRPTSDAGSSQPPTGQSSPGTPCRSDTEQAFIDWLAEPTSADELLLTGTPDPQPLARVLGELSQSSRVLPPETAARVGLHEGATIGDAAAELLLAVEAPAGPRCRSFRAAVYYLRDLDRFIDRSDGW